LSEYQTRRTGGSTWGWFVSAALKGKRDALGLSEEGSKPSWLAGEEVQQKNNPSKTEVGQGPGPTSQKGKKKLIWPWRKR